MVNNFLDGTICHVKFGETVGQEFNDLHLAVLFNIYDLREMVFCIPLTSPKEKHFRTQEDYELRNYLRTKHSRWHYIKDSDSIALLEQVRTISVYRILKYYNCPVTKKIKVLNEKEMDLLKEKTIKYIDKILYKNSTQKSFKKT